MNLKIFYLVVAIATISCGTGTTKVSSTQALQVGEDENFVLACALANEQGSARVYVLNGRVELRLENSGLESRLGFSLPGYNVSAKYVAASWQQVSIVLSSDDGRIFSGQLTQANAPGKQFNCLKVVTSERDDDEFSLVCNPSDLATADLDGKNVRLVVLSYEDKELEMLLNPATDGDIFDFERTTDLLVTDKMVEGSWEFEQLNFKANLLQDDRFSAALTHSGKASIPLNCWRI